VFWRPSRPGSSPSSASSRLISSCILLFYISGVSAQSADALYADRANLASATRAAALWSAALAADAADFEAAWKLARADYWLGGHAPDAERRRLFEQGLAAGEAAIGINPQRPEGYFWMAANMGALAESFGIRAGLKYRKPIKEALETVLRLDPAFQQGSADRALGRWYFKVPGLFGGSNRKSEEHLRKALTYNPQSVISHIFLADTLADMGRKDEARKEYQAAIDAPFHPDWIPEDKRFKEQAKRFLQQLSR